ncbi:hypothetical protein OIU76_027251 [Salix suchowensis]|nr:hypothetical protein OIU76_027251 [Salix suchowensis]
MESMISPQEIPNFETGEKHEIGVNNQIAGLGSNFMENGSSRKLLNCVAGTSRAMEVDRELVKPCSQTAVVEYADSVISSHSGTQNLNCEGNVCAVDEDLLLESGCLNMSRVLQKRLARGIGGLNLNYCFTLLLFAEEFSASTHRVACSFFLSFLTLSPWNWVTVTMTLSCSTISAMFPVTVLKNLDHPKNAIGKVVNSQDGARLSLKSTA